MTDAIPLMIMAVTFTDEQEILSLMRDAIQKYDKTETSKSKLCFAATMMVLKFRPDEYNDPLKLMKEYSEHSEWMKIKPKQQ
jgi:hypothetical protein